MAKAHGLDIRASKIGISKLPVYIFIIFYITIISLIKYALPIFNSSSLLPINYQNFRFLLPYFIIKLNTYIRSFMSSAFFLATAQSPIIIFNASSEKINPLYSFAIQKYHRQFSYFAASVIWRVECIFKRTLTWADKTSAYQKLVGYKIWRTFMKVINDIHQNGCMVFLCAYLLVSTTK